MNILGFDIGGTKCASILGKVENDGSAKIVEKITFPTKVGPNPTIETLFENSELLLEKYGLKHSDLSGVGISCGGPLDSVRGVIMSPPNLPLWDDVRIVEVVRQHFGVPAYVQNDANACAMAEWKYGAGKGFKNVVFLTFGTGMGSGIILDGKLFSGTSDMAGEVGHIRLSEFGPVGYGKAGSFEGWCSGGGLAQLGQVRARECLQMGQKVGYCKSLDELSYVTAKSIAEAAHSGDAVAIGVFDTCAEYLGRALSIIIDILNPQVIVLGSIYVRSGDLLEKRMWEVIKKESIHYAYDVCKIVPAQLQENIGDMAALVLAVEAATK